MTAKQADLFEKPKRQRARVMAHAIDTGASPHGKKWLARFRCRRCGAATGWYECDSISDIERGVPCEQCNNR